MKIDYDLLNEVTVNKKYYIKKIEFTKTEDGKNIINSKIVGFNDEVIDGIIREYMEKSLSNDIDPIELRKVVKIAIEFLEAHTSYIFKRYYH